jgi:anti-anti-sigma factor
VQQLPEQLSVKQGRGFFRQVESCFNVDRPRVVLDGSKVQLLDSAGVRVLLSCLEAAMKRNGDVKLALIPPGAAVVLELARVDHIFEVYESIADAVNSFYQFPTKSFQQTLRHDHSTLSSRARHNRFVDRHFDSREPPVTSKLNLRTSGRWLRRQIAGCLLLLFTAPVANAVPSPQQEANLSQDRAASSVQPHSQQANTVAKQANTEPSPSEALPDSPSSVRSKDRGSSGQPSPKLQDSPQDPLGTAAAPSVRTTGIAASRPAGAAIAPAKQKRARSILIKVGVIVGAAAAVGTVVALASASPSRPH